MFKEHEGQVIEMPVPVNEICTSGKYKRSIMLFAEDSKSASAIHYPSTDEVHGDVLSSVDLDVKEILLPTFLVIIITYW